MPKVLISHDRLLANPLGEKFHAAVDAAKISADALFLEIDADTLKRLIAEHSPAPDGTIRICLRDLTREASDRHAPDFYFAVVAAGKTGPGCIYIDGETLSRIRERFPKP